MSLFKSVLLLVPLMALALVLDVLALRVGHGARWIDPYLILVVAFAARGGRLRALAAGGLAGFVQDMVASIVFGVHYLGKLTVGYVASLLVGRLIPGQALTGVVLLGGGTLLGKVVQVALGPLLGSDFAVGTIPMVALEIVVNVLAGLLVFRLVDRWLRRRGPGASRAR